MSEFVKWATIIVIWTLFSGAMAGTGIAAMAIFGVWLFGFVWLTGFLLSDSEGADYLALYTFAPPIILALATIGILSIVH